MKKEGEINDDERGEAMNRRVRRGRDDKDRNERGKKRETEGREEDGEEG